MKKIISIITSIIMLICLFTSAMPSFALTYDSFVYEIVDEKIVITGYNGTDTTVTVPSTINDIPVVVISESAFKGNTTITSITVNEGIEDIGASTFENCTSLATISLPSTITHMGEKAIYNTAYYNDESNWKLKKSDSSSDDLNIGGSGVQDTITWEDVLAPELEYLYLGTTLIECQFSGIYRINAGTLLIADGAFKGSENATKIVFPSSLVAIGDYAFEGCLGIETFDISENISFSASSIYNTGFYNNSENWENGVLYMGTRAVGTSEKTGETVIKDGTIQIISGALGSKDAVIPASVTSISANAFTNTENVTIFGYTDTYAKTYADENSITFVDLNTVTKGDVNFDGTTDKKDYEILCSVSALQEYQSCAILLAGDMNEDGAIDGMDAVILDLFLNNIGPSTIKGDANGDGEISEADYDLLVQISLSEAEITDNYMLHRCDLNGDGAVDSFDALYLDLALNGLVAIV